MADVDKARTLKWGGRFWSCHPILVRTTITESDSHTLEEQMTAVIVLFVLAILLSIRAYYKTKNRRQTGRDDRAGCFLFFFEWSSPNSIILKK